MEIEIEIVEIGIEIEIVEIEMCQVCVVLCLLANTALLWGIMPSITLRPVFPG